MPALALGQAVFGITILVVQAAVFKAWPRAVPAGATPCPGVSILKPLYGEEPGLYECLRSFCVQDYPLYEVVFGVHDPDDAAIAVVRRLQREFPGRTLTLVIDPRRHGANAKVSNLINLSTAARHDILVLADADIRVGRDYLQVVTAELQDPGVGIVTCLYRARPGAQFWSRLEAIFIHDWFVPQVLLAKTLGSRDFAFGATIAVQRATLAAIGGFEGLASHLADDYELGRRTRALGLRTVLSSYLVETTVWEPRFRDLVGHQLRWLRTIRTINPAGYAFSWLTFGFPLAVAALLWAPQERVGILVFLALAARLVLHFRACSHLRAKHHFGLVPLADCVLCGLWAVALVGRRVSWRGAALAVGADGSIKANRE